MLKDSKRKKIASILFLISVCIVSLNFLLSGSGIIYGNKVIALVGKERIYEKDIKNELLEIFPDSNPRNFEIKRFPQNVLESIAQVIYRKKVIDKLAQKAMTQKEPSVRNEIKLHSDMIIRDAYLDSIVRQRITKESVRAKYLELSDRLKDDKEFGLSHILLKTKYQAEKISKKIKEGKESFSILSQKYSLDKKTRSKGGDLGYFKEDKVKEEFLSEVQTLQEGEISKPIKTKRGWHIVKLVNVKTPKLGDFRDVEGGIVEEMRKQELQRIFSEISDGKKVKLLVESN